MRVGNLGLERGRVQRRVGPATTSHNLAHHIPTWVGLEVGVGSGSGLGLGLGLGGQGQGQGQG